MYYVILSTSLVWVIKDFIFSNIKSNEACQHVDMICLCLNIMNLNVSMSDKCCFKNMAISSITMILIS